MDYTSIKVGQLPTDEISGGNFIPHEVNGVLKKATFTDLAAFIGASDAIGFRAVSVPNGGTLPSTDTQEFILVGPGTYNNVGGGSTITVTEELNALVSNGTYWFVGVEIPIDAPPGNAVWGQIIGTLSNQTDLKALLDVKADLVAGKVPSSQLPSYVDDVVEVADFAALPTTGETGKIYVTLDSGFIYRWTGTIYVRIADEAPTWGAIVGTLGDQTDLQTALNLRVPYTGATGNVDLGTHTLSSYNLIVNHTTGSGTAASITKGGNGEALTVVKSSGTGNVASITGGTTLISELHLTTDLADAYIASAATWNAKQNALSGTGFVKISGTTISYDNNTYALDSSVVHLAGTETITGSKIFNLAPYLEQNLYLKQISGWSNPSGYTVVGGRTDGLLLSATSSKTAYIGLGNLTQAQTFDFPNVSGTLALTSQIPTVSGNTNFLPKFTGSSALGNSQIFDNGTNVGIGTTSPSYLLDVNGGGIFRGGVHTGGSFINGVRIGYNTTDNYGFLEAVQVDATPRPLRINQYGGVTSFGGNVGIGTTSPSFLLHLYKASSDVVLALQKGSNYGYVVNDGTNIGFASDLGSTGYKFLVNRSAPDNAMIINSSGNVGIGTTSPSSKLSVDGDIRLQSSTASAKSIIFSSPASNWGPQDSSLKFIPADGVNAATSFTVNLWDGLGVINERMRITSGGTVCVGTTSPISSGTNTSTGATFANAYNWFAITDSNYFQRCNNTDGAILNFLRGSSAVGSITVTAVMTFFNTTSDYRLKQDFKKFNGLDLVSKIKVYDYEWKSNKSRMNGVIAHELQEVVPYAVTGEKDGEQMQSVDYSKLVPILVQAIQELKAEIEILKNK